MAKINQNEFNKWSEKLIEQIEITSIQPNDTEEIKEKTRKGISLFSNHIYLKNTFALLTVVSKMNSTVEHFEESFRNEKFSLPYENGELKETTIEQWYQYIFLRVEEHHKTRVGKEVGDEDLNDLMEKLKTISSWNKDEEKRKQLLSKIFQNDPKGYNLIWGIVDINENYKKIFAKNFVGGEDDVFVPTEKEIKQARYFFTDLADTIYKAQEALKEDNKQDYKPVNQEILYQEDLLKEQIEQLKILIKKLETTLTNNIQINSGQKKNLEAQLVNSNKLLKAKKANLVNLQETNDTDKDKMKPLVVIGMLTAGLALIGLIIAIIRRPRHHDY